MFERRSFTDNRLPYKADLRGMVVVFPPDRSEAQKMDCQIEGHTAERWKPYIRAKEGEADASPGHAEVAKAGRPYCCLLERGTEGAASRREGHGAQRQAGANVSNQKAGIGLRAYRAILELSTPSCRRRICLSAGWAASLRCRQAWPAGPGPRSP